VETLLDVGRLVLGGLVLYFGAEWLVKGSAGLARAFGVKPLVIGLTVVAYGTSAPELAVSSAAILKGSSEIVLGNVIGSCIANLGLILGITALVSPPGVDPRLIRREIPVMVLSVIALPVVLYDGKVSIIDALVLLGCSIAFTVVTLTVSSSDSPPPTVELPDEEPEKEPGEPGDRKSRLIGITLGGLALLVVGGELFVSGAKGIAFTIGMSDRVVGLTVVAIGTSLPELAASMVAAARGHASLAVGNVVGSNIFNIFLVLGCVGLIRPIEGSLATQRLDMLFLVGITVVGVLFMRGSRRINRLEGSLLLGAYVSFIALAILGF
jgi:cation:H+ antiporter